MEALGNLGINLSYLVVQILNFFIVMLIMSFWAYKPILKVLDERRDKIAQGLEDAREAEEARANAQSEAKKIIAEAQSERASIVADATARAEKTAADMRRFWNRPRKRYGSREKTYCWVCDRKSPLWQLRPQTKLSPSGLMKRGSERWWTSSFPACQMERLRSWKAKRCKGRLQWSLVQSH